MQKAAELANLPTEMDWELRVYFLDDPAMARSNADYVGHDGVTDVITFCYLEGGMAGIFPGDIGIELLIDPEVALREGSEREDSSYAQELMLYIVHGLLHSAGEDDLDPLRVQQMRRREKEVMDALLPTIDVEAIFPCP